MKFIDFEGLGEFILKAWDQIGFLNTLFFLFFWVAHYYYYRGHKQLIKQMQNEIDRIAKENREYRDRFMDFLDTNL
ncbi:MAG: hypothetical protein IIA49_17410 [Bacteroidetes bacterium]|nr:hypothetical protein [Bacteroidota bacterium]